MAALSTSLAPLVIARVIQGIGGACILPSTLSSVNALFRDKDRATAFGIWGAVMSGAAAVGPLLGGVLTQFAGWEAIFWVNVPIAVVLFILALRWVPNTAGDTNGAGGFDVLGLVLSGIGFGAVVFGIIQGAKIGFAFPSAPVVTLLVGAVVLVAFVLWENRRRKNADPALLDVSMFSYATFSWGNTTAMLVAVGEFALVFVLPLYLVSAIGLSTIATGLVLAAMALGAFFAGAMARHLAARITPAGVVIVGLGLEVFGSLQLAAEERVDLPLWLVVFALIIYGLGLGLASAQLTSLVLGDIPVRLSGAGVGDAVDNPADWFCSRCGTRWHGADDWAGSRDREAVAGPGADGAGVEGFCRLYADWPARTGCSRRCIDPADKCVCTCHAVCAVFRCRRADCRLPLLAEGAAVAQAG